MKKVLAKEKIEYTHLSQHETKQHVFLKFIALAVIVLIYFFFIASQYGIKEGFLVTALTWSFFVLCTPVADAGFLIDFPIRILVQMRMLVTEIFVWGIAILVNIYAFFWNPTVYEKTKILTLFHHILENPLPFWSIILVSLIGTFVSIQFGDELVDKVHHHERKFYHKHKYNYRLIMMIFIFAVSFILYDFLLKKLGVNLPI